MDMDTAVPQEAPFRSVEDIGIRVPVSMPEIDPAIEQTVARLAGITRGAGIVMAAQEIAADPNSGLRTVLALLKLLVYGRAQHTLDEITSIAPKLGCKSGCAYCCYQNVEVTIPEAILVAAHLTDPADPRRGKVAETAAAVRDLDDNERRRTGRPCPLLVANKCSIYDDRPLMCRSMLAVEAEQCRAAHVAATTSGETLPVEYFVTAQYFMLGDQAGLRGILKDMNLQYDLVELNQAVAAILRDPTLVDRWLAGERVFGPELIRA
jgi:Fe-S-cluster containining protein